MNYGDVLKEHRIASGKTLMQVEKDTGISNANLSRWENNKILPNIDFCVRLADYYEITLDELVGRDYKERCKTIDNSKSESLSYKEEFFYEEGNKKLIHKKR